MGRRNKLFKFSEILKFPNVYENYDAKTPSLIIEDGKEVEMKGSWRKQHFKNDNPLVLELACGRGEYSLSLARNYPNKNFIGLDIKGARIWQGASIALEERLDNVAFVRTRIELIEFFFEKDEIDEIWITFPDPFLRKSKANRRLTSPSFLKLYRTILKKGGIVHLKTDEPNLSEYTLEVIAEDERCNLLYHNDDIYADKLYLKELEYKTYYERMHLENGKTIKYIQYTIN